MKQRRKTFLAGLLSISMLLGSLGSSLNVMATASNETASEISNMTINYQTEPLGIATDNLDVYKRQILVFLKVNV